MSDAPTPSRSGLDAVLTSGFQFGGRYRPEHLIGRGGMANVYLGTDTRLQRRVAIKALRPEVAIDKDSRKRFQREAHAVSTMGHPSIVRVYDAGEEMVPAASTETLIPFIVMEYIDGKILRKLMDNGPFDPKVAIHITLGILDALDESHRAGIIHRDIKPGNVMVTPTGLVKVCDFGIAQAIEDPTNDPSSIVGTAQYFSPEQAKGEIIDGRSDLYSTAVVLFEMVTGTRLFTGETSVAVAFQHVTQTAPRARSRRPELSPELDVIIAKALEKDRSLRFGSAADFAAALRGIKLTARDSPSEHTGISPETVESTVNRVATVGPSVVRGHRPTLEKESSMDLSEIRESFSSDDVPKPQTLRWIIASSVAVVFVASVLAGTLYWLLTAGTPQSSPGLAVEVPAVSLKSSDEAVELFESLGLRVELETVSSDTVPAGSVISSAPVAGVRVAPGELILLTVSSGAVRVDVPDFELMTLSEAQEICDELGLEIGFVTVQNSATVGENKILESTPAAGEAVEAGSLVDFLVSSGKVSVPDVTGKSISAAKTLLESSDVQYRVEVVTDSTCTGSMVKSQSIAPGIQKQRQTIALTYCAG